MSDEGLVEFQEMVGTGRSRQQEHELPPSTANETIGNAELAKERRTEPDGKVVQWALEGPNFTATSRTYATLPAGAYYVASSPRGVFACPMELETDKLLRLPDSASDQVIGEVDHFWTREEAFRRLGFVHKRGFLLWGAQGSGKTSTVEYVAAQHIKDGGLVILPSASPGVVATLLGNIRSIEPKRRLLVPIEDIDSYIEHNTEAAVLSLLDGEHSIGGVVFIATTNYPEKLEARVANRPSRFDRVIKIGMPTEAARRMFLESRDLGLAKKELTRWVDLTKDLSIAHLKEIIIAVLVYEMKVDDAVARMHAMERTPKSTGGRRIGIAREEEG